MELTFPLQLNAKVVNYLVSMSSLFPIPFPVLSQKLLAKIAYHHTLGMIYHLLLGNAEMFSHE